MTGLIRTKAHAVMVAWLAAWPTLTAVLFCLQPFTHDWPLPLRSLASATAMAILMNLVSVPFVRKLLDRAGKHPRADSR